jgi:hypothetical protein
MIKIDLRIFTNLIFICQFRLLWQIILTGTKAPPNITADITLNTWYFTNLLMLSLLDNKFFVERFIEIKRLYYDVSLSIIATPLLMFPFAWIDNKHLQCTLSPSPRVDQKRYCLKQNEFIRY